MDLYIYGEIGVDIRPEDVRLKLENTKGDITLRVASPGGYVFDGYAIYNLLKDSGRVKEAYIDGLCGSIATLIVNSAEKVYMSAVGNYMIHNPWSSVQGEAKDMIKEARTLDKIKDVLVSIYSQKTQKPKDIIERMMNDETYMSAEDALSMGFVDKIIDRSKMVAKIKHYNNMNSNDEKEVKGMFAEIKALLTGKSKKEQPKNMGLQLDNGQMIFVQTEDGDLVGKEVFLATESGEPTEDAAPDGTHLLTDGRSIVVESGVITAVEEPEMEDVEAMKKKMKEMEEELAGYREKDEAAQAALQDATQKAENLEAENTELKNTIQNKMKALEEKVFGNPEPAKVADAKDSKNTEPHPMDGFANYLKSTFKNRIN